jgi:hypothetical protein
MNPGKCFFDMLKLGAAGITPLKKYKLKKLPNSTPLSHNAWTTILAFK